MTQQKQSGRVAVGLRLKPEDAAKLSALAQAETRTMAKQAEHLVLEALRNRCNQNAGGAA